MWAGKNSQLRFQLRLASPSFFLLLRYHEAGVSEEDACSVCASMWPDWVGEVVEVELLLFLRVLAECRERDKDEPSVDGTCKEPKRPSGPLRLIGSRLSAKEGPRGQITRKDHGEGDAGGPSAASGEKYVLMSSKERERERAAAPRLRT